MDTFLLIKYFKCATSPEEEKQIAAWLANDPDGSHRSEYEAMHAIYDGMVIHASPSVVSKARKAPRTRKRVIFSAAAKRAIAICANVAAIVAIAFGVFFLARNEVYDNLSAQFETLSVPAGKSIEITLEDGTDIFLNSGTVIQYPKLFSNKKREVKVLQGEALFDVTSDEDRPFYVETYASTVKVLGTKFNIIADPEKDFCSTTLLRGLVKVSNKANDKEVVLNPNMKAEIVGDDIKVVAIDDAESVICWTDGLIDIKDISFDRLMSKFENAFGVRILIERTSLPEIRFTRGKIRVSDGLDHALEVLKLASHFDYERDYETDTIYIK